MFGVLLIAIGLLGVPGAVGWIAIHEGFGDEHFWLTLVTGSLAIYFGTAGARLRTVTPRS